jgi:2-polyprenyl-3-methyl-5-hydroxy-6-metoxy-1,4-benzoquinol methylase
VRAEGSSSRDSRADRIAARVRRLESHVVRLVLQECVEGNASPPITLARLLLALDDVGEVESLLERVLGAGKAGTTPVDEIARLLRAHRLGCEDAAAILHEHPDPEAHPANADDEIAACRRFFDRAVARNELASVAAYSLGDPEILDACTAEVVALLESWGLLSGESRGHRSLEIGCGIGRIQAVLAPRLAETHGIDISPKMIDAARRRCAGLPNVHLSCCSGRDLDGFADASFDLVLAIDSFPYLFQAGFPLVTAHVREVARVLRPGGDLVIFNFSYRDRPDADRRDLGRLAERFGFEVLQADENPFRIWDALVYHLRLAPTAGAVG